MFMYVKERCWGIVAEIVLVVNIDFFRKLC